MGHEKDMLDMEDEADKEAGVVVFEDLTPDPDSGVLVCECGARKRENHKRIRDGGLLLWCPNDRTAPPPRPSWDQFFMDIAMKTATRATCDRKHVGCVMVIDKRIVAGGYNGSISGLDHCDDVGHDMLDGHCVRTVHAEANAVADAARRGVALHGATAYVTALPCWRCFKLLVQAGIRSVIFLEAYRIEDETNRRTFEAATLAKIHVSKFGL